MIINSNILIAKSAFSRFRDSDFRTYQAEAVEFAMNSPKKVVAIEAPTGFGKSLTAACICQLSESSIYLVHSKSLQQQINDDFPEFKILWGRSNYACDLYSQERTCADCPFRFPQSCAYFGTQECLRLNSTRTDAAKKCNGTDSDGCLSFQMNCPIHKTCQYKLAKNEALKSKLRVLNYSYFLTETNYVGKFSDQQIIVCDEADVLENELLNMVGVSISKKQLHEFGLSEPSYKTVSGGRGVQSWKSWANECYRRIKIAHERLSRENITKREEERLTGLINKFHDFELSVDESWIYNVDTRMEYNPRHVFKPTWLTPQLTQDYLWQHSEKFVLMSATFPPKDTIAQCLGLNVSDIDLLELPSTFPVERRPIYVQVAASLSAGNTDDEFPKIAQKVREILDKHKSDKGLIHTSNYKIANRLVQDIGGRLLGHVTSDRLDVLELFKQSTEPLVLVSPSMERGVSLSDELARFIVIVKAPFADLGDKQTSARLYGSGSAGRFWYQSMTAQTIEQMCGRGFRHAGDFCSIYVIDGNIRKLITEHPRLFSDYFRSCIQW